MFHVFKHKNINLGPGQTTEKSQRKFRDLTEIPLRNFR